MQRPDKIYLDQPIKIDGITITHTKQGLEYKIEHYQHILSTATPKQLDDRARQHIETVVLVNFKTHLHLIETHQIQ